MDNDSSNSPIVLITGGSGFLGKRIVEEFLLPDSLLRATEIRVFDIKPYEGPYEDQIQFINGDITDQQALNEACKGVDLVVHSAAVIDWGVKDESFVLDVNVGGTEKVVEACRKTGVKALIYTSSLDAIYTGSDLRDIDESQPYPEKFQTSYCKSKSLSEKVVIGANGNGLKTLVLRPSDIYGEDDPYHIDPLIDMAKGGFYTRLGNGTAKCQHVYVGNMAYAHVLAAKALLDGKQEVSGKPYFITDGPGSNFFHFFDRIVEEAGYSTWPKKFWIPKSVALPLAAMAEFGGAVLKPVLKTEVKFTRFAVNYTCNDFTFNSSNAEKDFGFRPKYSVEESIARTAEFYQKQHA